MSLKAVESRITMNRKAGILVHPTSFPGPYGIGDLGQSAYDFIDFLVLAGQNLWQVLPLGPTGYGDSPYQSFSSFAGQPLIISPDLLGELGLLTQEELMDRREWNPTKIDFGPTINYKTELLKKAFLHFQNEEPIELAMELRQFEEEQKEWLADYALFMAVKDAHGGVKWSEWTPEIAFPTQEIIAKWQSMLTQTVAYNIFVQFIFFKQWNALKTYANEKGISIIGDIPIFTAYDSADVWAHKDLFYLDAQGHPTFVAGVPPDYFSQTGQLWGNPLYNWEKHHETDYQWWVQRIGMTLKMVDHLRIDHFRGFEGYWAIPYGSAHAVHGEWRKGPSKDLFYALEKALGKDLAIIAEDLGLITQEVEELRDQFHFSGMKILQFAFDNTEENAFLPHQFVPKTVCYTGTHDNDTTLGWYLKASSESQDKVRRYMNSNHHDIVWDFIRTCYSSVSEMAIIPLQDVMGLDSWARMNMPGSPIDNWQWRYTPEMLTTSIAKELWRTTELYGRLKC